MFIKRFYSPAYLFLGLDLRAKASQWNEIRFLCLFVSLPFVSVRGRLFFWLCLSASWVCFWLKYKLYFCEQPVGARSDFFENKKLPEFPCYQNIQHSKTLKCGIFLQYFSKLLLLTPISNIGTVVEYLMNNQILSHHWWSFFYR